MPWRIPILFFHIIYNLFSISQQQLYLQEKPYMA